MHSVADKDLFDLAKYYEVSKVLLDKLEGFFSSPYLREIAEMVSLLSLVQVHNVQIVNVPQLIHDLPIVVLWNNDFIEIYVL